MRNWCHNYITGAGGFLGSRLLKALQKAKEYTVVIQHCDIDSIRLCRHKRLFFCSTYGNLAHHASDPDAPAKTLKANLSDVLQLCVGQRIIYLSTSAVNLPVQTHYSTYKRMAENFLLMFKKHAIIRPFSVTGVGEQDCHLIPRLIHCAFTGEQMPFYPKATHDFVDVEDVVRGIIAIGLSDDYGIFELGSGVSYTNGQVKKMVEKAVGKRVKTFSAPGREYDNQKWVSTQRNHHWMPRKSLEQSIYEMVEHYDKTRKKGD